MLKIYKRNEVKMGDILQDPDRWDYPIDELRYLLYKDEGDTAYVLYGDRLWEVFPEDVKEVK